MKKLAVLCLLVATVCCLSFAASSMAASVEEEVLQVKLNWIKAFNTMDLKLMSSLYWNSPKTSTFPPNDFLYQGWDEITTMLKKEFQNPPGTLVWSVHHPQVTMLSDDIAVITAYDSVEVVDKGTTDHLRVTQVVQKIGGKWLIVHDNGAFVFME